MGTIRDARFLSHVERTFADALAPLGLRADRAIGLRVGRTSFQPVIAIMPEWPDDPEAVWHSDFVGAVFLTRRSDKVGIPWILAPRAMTGTSCRFAAIVHTEEGLVDLWTREFDGRPLFPTDRITVDEIEIPVKDLYDPPLPRHR